MSASKPIKAPITQLTTTNGVVVTVDPSRTFQPRRRPALAPRPEPVVVRPPVDPKQERDALVARAFAQHAAFLRRMLLRRKDILPESAKDVAQRAFIVLSDRIEKEGAPENVRGFLVGVVRREVCGHKQRWKLPTDDGADGAEVPSPANDPEQMAQIMERWEKLMLYLERLPAEEADAYERVDLDGKQVDEAARELGRPCTTFAGQLARARFKLKEFAEESARAAEARANARGAG